MVLAMQKPCPFKLAHISAQGKFYSQCLLANFRNNKLKQGPIFNLILKDLACSGSNNEVRAVDDDGNIYHVTIFLE